MMAFMLTTVIEQSFFVYKACSVNHGYNDTICRNINNKKYENITKEVQVSVLCIVEYTVDCRIYCAAKAIFSSDLICIITTTV